MNGQETAHHRLDPDGWGYSLANVKELLFSLLEAAGARSVIEIGAFRGQLTAELLRWGRRSGARICAIDPDPPAELLELRDQNEELELVTETSHEALGHLSIPDAVIVDGDHNYYTVTEELRLIYANAAPATLPLVLFHDVCWPLARRDTYHVPERIPEEFRHPVAPSRSLAAEPSFSDTETPFALTAQEEGGPRNGVLTAVEDFLLGRGDLRLAVIPAFFGLGVLWSLDAPWSAEVTRIVDPLDRNPVLARLEASRAANLIAGQGRVLEIANLREQLQGMDERLRRQELVIQKMLSSRAFALAERVFALHRRGGPVVSREEMEQALR